MAATRDTGIHRIRCPLCRDEHPRCAGVDCSVDIRGSVERLIAFTCCESHTFFLRAADVPADVIEQAALPNTDGTAR